MTTAYQIDIPEVDQAVRVRNRLATARAVEPYDTRTQGRLNIVEFEYQDAPDTSPHNIERIMTRHTPDTFSLILTQRQREAMIQMTRLHARIKNLLRRADEGKQAVAFSEEDLRHLAIEIGVTLRFAPGPHKKTLVAVNNEAIGLLEAIVARAEAPKQRRRTTISADESVHFHRRAVMP